MMFKSPSSRSYFGPFLVLCCVVLGFLAMQSAVAQDANHVCIEAPMEKDGKSYATMVFCVAPEVVVEPENIEILNYSSGKEVVAFMLLNGSKTAIHILYPCQAPAKMLDAPELKSAIDTYDSILAQANYSVMSFSISGKPTIGGQLGNLAFFAYQPSNQTVGLVMVDSNMSNDIANDFLPNLRLTIADGVSPLEPGYCPEAPPAQSSPAVAEASDTQAVAQPAPEVGPAVVSQSLTAQKAAQAQLKQSVFERNRARMEEMKKSVQR